MAADYTRDPLKAYKFRARFLHGDTEGFFALMSVQGLRVNHQSDQLLFTRGVITGHTELLDWFARKDTRNIDITVEDGFVFHVHGATPDELFYSDLDAGVDSRSLFLERLLVSYSSLIPEYL